MLLWHLVVLEHLHGPADLVSTAHDWIEEKHLSFSNVARKLGENDARLVSLEVGVNKNLPDAHGAAAIYSKGCMHQEIIA